MVEEAAISDNGAQRQTSTSGLEIVALDNNSHELRNGKEVYFRCEGNNDPNDCCRFHVDVEEPCLLKIETWRVEGDSNPSLFVDIDNAGVSATSHQFRASRNGKNHVTMCPQDPQF